MVTKMVTLASLTLGGTVKWRAESSPLSVSGTLRPTPNILIPSTQRVEAKVGS